MKRITLIVISLLLIGGCQKKSEEKFIFDIQGIWYGHLDEHYVSEPEQHIVLTLERGKASIYIAFHSYSSGWYDSEGTYTQDADGTIWLNIPMTIPDMFKDFTTIPKITLTHATVAYSDLSGDLLHLHFNKEYQGEITSHWIWLDRNR